MFKSILFWMLVVAIALIIAFVGSCLSGDITLSETLLSLRSSSLLSFLKKSKKKRGKGKEISFSQISFLKKKIKKKEWRELREYCLLECRGVPPDKFLTEKYTPPCKFFAGRKEEREEFRKFWEISSTSSSLNEKEKEWVEEVEENAERKEKSEFLKIEI